MALSEIVEDETCWKIGEPGKEQSIFIRKLSGSIILKSPNWLMLPGFEIHELKIDEQTEPVQLYAAYAGQNPERFYLGPILNTAKAKEIIKKINECYKLSQVATTQIHQ